MGIKKFLAENIRPILYAGICSLVAIATVPAVSERMNYEASIRRFYEALGKEAATHGDSNRDGVLSLDERRQFVQGFFNRRGYRLVPTDEKDSNYVVFDNSGRRVTNPDELTDLLDSQ